MKKRVYPDGTVKILYSDGRQETRYSNGRVRIKDPQGKLIKAGFKNNLCCENLAPFARTSKLFFIVRSLNVLKKLV